jgi:hypothetical protein
MVGRGLFVRVRGGLSFRGWGWQLGIADVARLALGQLLRSVREPMQQWLFG